MNQSINGDLEVKVVVDTETMDWQPSPSGTVWRKRVHLVGPPESGQVTSLVRYQPGSVFPGHDHPDGEEIFVLEGVFSDEHGDWPAGTYLLNPEGFRHAPFSKSGCLLFVKLRQFPGRDRRHVALQTQTRPWVPTGTAGVETRRLYQQSGYSDESHLERWAEAAIADATDYAEGAEIFVIDGTLINESGSHPAGTWLRFPRGAHHTPSPGPGCTLYLKTGHLRYLNSSG